MDRSQRTILHVDLDAFFAAVEQRDGLRHVAPGDALDRIHERFGSGLVRRAVHVAEEPDDDGA